MEEQKNTTTEQKSAPAATTGKPVTPTSGVARTTRRPFSPRGSSFGNRPSRPTGSTGRGSFSSYRGPRSGTSTGASTPASGDQSDKAKQAESRNERRASKGGDRRERSEFDQKIVSMRRVTRVVSGGRRFSFSVALVAGDKNGRVGIGLGKAGDTALAIDKALRNAKKHMIRVKLTNTRSIPHEVETKYSSAIVRLTPARGRGMVAGSSVRSVLELVGVTDVVAKLFSGSKNHLNQARAVIKALGQLKQPIAKREKQAPVAQAK